MDTFRRNIFCLPCPLHLRNSPEYSAWCRRLLIKSCRSYTILISGMPHTSHRKKKSVHKRVEVTDEDGWTRVTSTNAQRRAPRSAATSAIKEGLAYESPPEKGTTVEKIRARYNEIETQWQSSDACRSLVVCLQHRVPTEALQVDRCIIFGSGSFCGLRQGWIKGDTASLCQLAVLSTLRTTIGEYYRAGQGYEY